VPGIKVQDNDADGDPLGRDAVLGRNSRMEQNKMYTGTLIDDLMTTVERVEYNVRRHNLVEELRMPILLDLRDPAVVAKPALALAGAA